MFHVAPALAQRRDVNGEHVQTEVKVLAKLPIRAHPLQIAIRGGHDAHVHFHGLRAAQRFELAFLKHAQKFRLQFSGSSPTSSRKIVPPFARENRPSRG